MPALLLLLAACVIDRGDWFRSRDDVLCALYVDCFAAYDDRAACRADLATFDDPPCEDFAPAAARDCLADLRAQVRACPSDAAAWEVPASCADVCTPVPP